MKKLAFFFIFCLGTVCLTEVFLRIKQHLTLHSSDIEARQYSMEVFAGIYTQWMDTKPRKDIFVPPFLVYSNKDNQNPVRLEMIYQTTRLPAAQTFESYDFIQAFSKANLTKYSISINSLGFRGKERQAQKKSGTYRIFALGSYHTFGHGVNDDETYGAQLEKRLNDKLKKTGKTFEFWNAGRHAGTAIIGLAMLKNEILKYAPDLLILDYGFIDHVVWGDNLMPAAMRMPDSGPSIIFRKVMAPLMSLAGHSVLYQELSNRYFLFVSKERFDQYQSTIQQMLDIATQNGIPVLFLQQQFGVPVLIDLKGSQLVQVTTAYERHPVLMPDQKDWKSGYWQTTWLPDIKPEWFSQPTFLFPQYRLNFFQVNKYGHESIAAELAEVIEKNYLRETH